MQQAKKKKKKAATDIVEQTKDQGKKSTKKSKVKGKEKEVAPDEGVQADDIDKALAELNMGYNLHHYGNALRLTFYSPV